MSWNIGIKENTLKMPPDVVEKLIAVGEENYHNLSFYKDKLYFDSDAMEHMDCVWEDWFLDTLKDTDTNGDVVFMSAEGDNSGKIWGYRFKNGAMTKLKAIVTMVEDI